jgi:uncharacterized membrane protein YqhA
MAFRRADERRWLLGIALLTACSWGRWLSTGSLKVDESYPSELVGSLLLLGLLAGWALLVLGWRGLLARPSFDARRLAYAGLAVSSLMLPMLSNDVFSLFAYSSAVAHGGDVYTATAALAHTPWASWVGQRWSETVCVYGPAALVAILPSSLGGAHPFLALFALRLAWLVPLVLVMELSFRRLADRPGFHAMVWCNPLFLVEGPGHLHVDLLGLLAVVAGIALQRRGATKWGWSFFSVALLSKYTFALGGPWFWLSGAKTPRERALRLPAMVGLFLALAALFFAPFWHGIATVLDPMRALARMNPGGSITEVVSDLVLLARGGKLAPPEMPVQGAMARDRASLEAIWVVVSLAVRLVALGIAARVLREMWKKPNDEATLALGTGTLVVAALTLASHRFQSWYLLAPLPFFGMHSTRGWRRWWVAALAFCVPANFVHVLPRTAHLLPPLVAIFTGGATVVFVLWFRERYLDFGAEEPRGASGVRGRASVPALELDLEPTRPSMAFRVIDG